MEAREIIDAHVHLWNPQQFRLRWLDQVPALNKPFGVSEFALHSTGTAVAAMVYVEVDVAPHYALLEAQWAVAQSEYDSRLQGIVAVAPVEYGEHVGAYHYSLQA